VTHKRHAYKQILPAGGNNAGVYVPGSWTRVENRLDESLTNQTDFLCQGE